jgi:hypothetical protein
METIEKINDSEIKIITPQEPKEDILNIDDLVKRREEKVQERDLLNGVINDFDILIKKTKDAGCVENAEVVENPISQNNEDVL